MDYLPRIQKNPDLQRSNAVFTAPELTPKRSVEGSVTIREGGVNPSLSASRLVPAGPSGDSTYIVTPNKDTQARTASNITSITSAGEVD